MALQFTKNALNPSQSVWRASLVACAAAAFSIAAVVACSSNDPTGNPDEGSSGFTPVPAP